MPDHPLPYQPPPALEALLTLARGAPSAESRDGAEVWEDATEEVWKRLCEAGDRCATASKELDDALANRDRAILEASEQGYSRRDVARAAGVSPGRVQQILDR